MTISKKYPEQNGLEKSRILIKLGRRGKGLSRDVTSHHFLEQPNDLIGSDEAWTLMDCERFEKNITKMGLSF